MSVQTQIDRISGNVTAALAAIADKGVTVPSGSTSDALAGLIASIEAGGGSASGFAKVATGTIIPSSNVTSLTIEHGLGQAADITIVYIENANNSAIAPKIKVVISATWSNRFSVSIGHSARLVAAQVSTSGNNVSADSSIVIGGSMSVAGASGSATAPFYGGETYHWIAGVYAS